MHLMSNSIDSYLSNLALFRERHSTQKVIATAAVSKSVSNTSLFTPLATKHTTIVEYAIALYQYTSEIE